MFIVDISSRYDSIFALGPFTICGSFQVGRYSKNEALRRGRGRSINWPNLGHADCERSVPLYVFIF